MIVDFQALSFVSRKYSNSINVKKCKRRPVWPVIPQDKF